MMADGSSVAILERELAETRKLLAEKDAVIAAQSARIKELEESLGKNSQNSSVFRRVPKGANKK